MNIEHAKKRLLTEERGILSKKPLAEKSSHQMVANQEMLRPQMIADQEVGSPHIFLTLCLITQLKRGGGVFQTILLMLDHKYFVLIIKIY